MIKISFIIPEQSLVDLVFKSYHEHNELYIKNVQDDISYSLFVFVAATIEDVTPAALDADILIARGLIVKKLKERYPDTAIIEIPISGVEIVATIQAAVLQAGKQPIALIAALNVLYSANGIDTNLGIDIKSYLLEDNDDIKIMVDKAVKDNRKVIICGPNTKTYATFCGCQCIVFGMTKESICKAISEAKYSSVIRRREKEKSMQLDTILTHAYEGIVVIDASGKISILNTVAQNILGISSSEVIGKSAHSVLPRSIFNSVLQVNKEYSSELISFNNHQLYVNKVVMKFRNDMIGNIINLKEVSETKQIEFEIRGKLCTHGHLAKYHFSDIIGNSPAILTSIETAKDYANVSSNVLICGNTGTGKELFAQSIHNTSRRRNGPFVAVNCAALSKSLLESELFGYVEGAFTGAIKTGKIGLFELAHTGTIFLDEVSELPMELQGKLLRVIEEREIMRLGDNRVIAIDVRIISATNKNLIELVRNGKFRNDLYYRLDVLALNLPTLLNRDVDILLLANKFIEDFCVKFVKKSISISDKASKILLKHTWEGNVRELRNICERLVVLNKKGIIDEDDLSISISTQSSVSTHKIPCLGNGVDDFQKENILKALKRCENDKNFAAKMLGISKSTLWRRIKKYNIKT
ncbi:sigma 54-interacting transcriptional regulator [Clostridium estertheticum]|uniref:sigma 54-interacting transcriptional regulator n=1 Tax=Clostridium estertheticum TaxID=238834 RepID=UPI001C6EA58C|nr:sigma 54-interacting transcriptional regulator [Clostridium estertheticum]MBW9171554.1 sigma 54-interacting transcriptional regulator [Clostridium estertheticum]WLC77053.1 sigma 54-interacting transcriptional regulator [Clostridium estertheticum]